MTKATIHKGIATLLLALVFVIGACGQGTDTPAGGTAPAAAPAAGETETPATAAGEDAGGMPSFRVIIGRPAIIEDLQTNDVSIWLEEHTGIFVQYDQLPMEGIDERVALMIAGGDLPDAFIHSSISAAQVVQFGIMDEQFIPLDNLIHSYIPNLIDAMNHYGRGLDLIRQVDGQIWGLPAINPCYHCSRAHRMWVNVEWRDNLNIPVPTTIDEFTDMLRSFRDNDPTGTGSEVIPLSGSMTGSGWHTQSLFFLAQSFLPFDHIQHGFMVDANDRVYNAITDPRFREALRYLNMLHTEGLMYSGALIQDQDMLRMQMMNPGHALVGAASGGFHGQLGEIGSERMRQYLPQRPLIGPGGEQHSWSSLQEPMINRLVITRVAEDPALIARWANYFYSHEVTATLYNGLEDIGWRWAEGGEVGFHGNPALWFALVPYFAEMGGQRNDVWTQLGIFNYSHSWRVGQAVEPGVDLYSPEGLENLLHIVTEQYMEPYNWDHLVLPTLNLTADEFNVVGILRTEWEIFFEESIFNFVSGQWNLEGDWDTFINNVYGVYRMNDMLEIYQAAFDRAYGG